jgi:hypothetical protein
VDRGGDEEQCKKRDQRRVLLPRGIGTESNSDGIVGRPTNPKRGKTTTKVSQCHFRDGAGLQSGFTYWVADITSSVAEATVQ